MRLLCLLIVAVLCTVSTGNTRDCAEWAQEGECVANPAYMLTVSEWHTR
jgi:hypothetical protein